MIWQKCVVVVVIITYLSKSSFALSLWFRLQVAPQGGIQWFVFEYLKQVHVCLCTNLALIHSLRFLFFVVLCSEVLSVCWVWLWAAQFKRWACWCRGCRTQTTGSISKRRVAGLNLLSPETGSLKLNWFEIHQNRLQLSHFGLAAVTDPGRRGRNCLRRNGMAQVEPSSSTRTPGPFSQWWGRRDAVSLEQVSSQPHTDLTSQGVEPLATLHLSAPHSWFPHL